MRDQIKKLHICSSIIALQKYSVKRLYCIYVVQYIIMKSFADRLRELRKEKGLSSMALGNSIGVRDSTIIRWENNQNDIKAEQLVKLAQFFGVTTDYLLGLED